VFEYSNRKLIKEQVFDGDKNLKSEKSFTLDKSGNIMELKTWDDEYDRKIKRVNTYNENDKRISTMTYSENGDLLARETIKYDTKGQAVEVIEENPSETNTLYLVYDENGNVINQEEYNATNELNHKVNRKFDEHNEIIESDVYIDRHGESMNQHYIIRMEYAYFD